MAYADTFGFKYAWRSNNSCLSAWRISWHQKFMGNDDAVPNRTPTKWSLHLCIAFSVILRRCPSGGTSLCVIPDYWIASLYALAALLSSTWCVGVIPQIFMRSRARVWHRIISSSVLLFNASTHVELLYISWRKIWYLFPRLYTCGRLPIWSEYMIDCISYVEMRMSCCFYLLVVSRDLGSSAGGSFFLVESKPYRCPFMWPCCVSLELGKCFVKFLTMTSGQVR